MKVGCTNCYEPDTEIFNIVTPCELSVTTLRYALGFLRAGGCVACRLEVGLKNVYWAERVVRELGASEYIPRVPNDELGDSGWMLYGVPIMGDEE